MTSVRARAILLTMLLALVVVGAIVAAQRLLSNDVRLARQVRPTWPGPVHIPPGMPVGPQALGWGGLAQAESPDAQLNWLDITSVGASTEFGQLTWRIELAGSPPRAEGLDPAQTVISYGLVCETTGDGRADYVVGINNDAPVRGQFRVWVTDLASGSTTEQVGPPYGFPVEFRHPDEASPDEPVSRTVTLLFLRGAVPPGLTEDSRYYAWSALARAGETVAWDYAPLTTWIGNPAR